MTMEEKEAFDVVINDLKRNLINASNARDHAYRERNILVVLLARLALSLGQRAGVGYDPKEPAWPVVFIETSAGQVSWHFSPEDAALAADLPRYEGRWDGHTTEEKWRRVTELMHKGYP